jgi:adenylate cyclase
MTGPSIWIATVGIALRNDQWLNGASHLAACAHDSRMSTFCSTSPRRISGTESLDEILEALVEMTSLAISCDRSSFFLNDPGTGELYSRVAQGVRRREIRLLNNDGVVGAAFQTGRSIIIDDAYADPRFNPSIDRETGYVTKSVLCVPLCTAKGDVIGVSQALQIPHPHDATSHQFSLIMATR